ncbi:hypothetical protein, partial [Zavarzinella formosa]|uniref:hypothetical protein n=1 Tax=Zavarzinella formosa TaxID=360055 RepID=UPI001EE6884D
RDQEVAGSNPVSSIVKALFFKAFPSLIIFDRQFGRVQDWALKLAVRSIFNHIFNKCGLLKTNFTHNFPKRSANRSVAKTAEFSRTCEKNILRGRRRNRTDFPTNG